MTRTSSSNFTGANSFPKADAATDPFLRQDIQQLAAAVDAHDHTTGKGVVVTTGAGQLPLDVPPTTPSAYDDEFTTGVAGKWTVPLTTAVGTTTSSLSGGWAKIKSSLPSGSVGRGPVGMRQSISAGSFQIMAKLAVLGGGTDARVGLFVARTANTQAHVWGMNRDQNLLVDAIGCASYSESVAWGAYDGYDSSGGGAASGFAVWYRIRYDATLSTLYWDYSTMGLEWVNWGSRASQSQPDRIGFAIYANTAFTFSEAMYAEWFRYLPNATF